MSVHRGPRTPSRHNRYRLPITVAASTLVALGAQACGSGTGSTASQKSAPRHEANQKTAFEKAQASTIEALKMSSLRSANAILDHLARPGVESPDDSHGADGLVTSEGLHPFIMAGYNQDTGIFFVSANANNGSHNNLPYTGVSLLFQVGANNPIIGEAKGARTVDSYRLALANPDEISLAAASGQVNDDLKDPKAAFGVAVRDGKLYAAPGNSGSLMGQTGSFAVDGSNLVSTQAGLNNSVVNLDAILGQAAANLGI